MRNFKIHVAGLYVTISARYDLGYNICRPYLTDRPWTDITLYVTPAAIEAKKASMPITLTDEMAECICLNDQLSLKLLLHDAFLLHAAVLQMNGKCYAFSGPRGAGKSTHAAMWQKQFGEENVAVINGDKPIIRRGKDGRFCAYGTPWCGKEGLQTPRGVVVDCITFIEQAPSDRAVSLTEREYLDRLIGQVVFPADEKSMKRGAALLADFMRATPAALAYCTPTPSAAKCVHDYWN